MNYLSICQRLRSEAGISGTGPTSVLSQTGEFAKVVEWVDTAYEDIQNVYATWRFLRSDFDFSTEATTQEYTPNTILGLGVGGGSMRPHASWITEDMRVYSAISDELFLDDPTWDDFKLAYMYGNLRTQSGKPIAVSVRPSNNALVFYPVPDAVYTVVGEYYETPDIMEVDGDEPIFPTRFHMAIVWRALMLYGAFTAADEKYAHGKAEYDKIMLQLTLDQLEQVTYGDPLA